MSKLAKICLGVLLIIILSFNLCFAIDEDELYNTSDNNILNSSETENDYSTDDYVYNTSPINTYATESATSNSDVSTTVSGISSISDVSTLTNILNIVLIVIGILLILLAIAILIRLH